MDWDEIDGRKGTQISETSKFSPIREFEYLEMKREVVVDGTILENQERFLLLDTIRSDLLQYSSEDVEDVQFVLKYILDIYIHNTGNF